MSSEKQSPFHSKVMVAMEADEENSKPTLQACEAKQEPNESSLKPPQPQKCSSDDQSASIDPPPKKSEDSSNEENGNEENGDGDHDEYDDEYLDSFPPGFRFNPVDEELILQYLKKKVLNMSLPPNRIYEVNLYAYNPEKLAEENLPKVTRLIGSCMNIELPMLLHAKKFTMT
ncbi:No apical meristem (NAM) protein [Corchorus olitorius]|uniref:No apical meristem (NAM) protein n=1 Tax=Corchorus olitorius TaxID=93759 RepID=A0A1R3KTB5_9ROSI|nr:No apical meristem (NAM) protein [Corchorus olitorius]